MEDKDEGSAVKRSRPSDAEEEGELTAREEALLEDLIIARDALDKMKGLLSQRIRYEQQLHSSQTPTPTPTPPAASMAETAALQKENRALRKALRQTRGELERHRSALGRLEFMLAAEGVPLDKARAISSRAAAPPDLRLVWLGSGGGGKPPGEDSSLRPGEEKVQSKKSLRPAPTVRLEGRDADLMAKDLSVRVRAMQADRVVDDVLSGDLVVPVDPATSICIFSRLSFVKTSLQCNDLPFTLMFSLVLRGVALEPPVQLRSLVEYLVTSHK